MYGGSDHDCDDEHEDSKSLHSNILEKDVSNDGLGGEADIDSSSFLEHHDEG